MTTAARVDGPTIIGWGLLLLPALTMWHEIGGHALACMVTGGTVMAIGAFYVRCNGLSEAPMTLVAVAGVTANLLLALMAHWRWRRARTDTGRLTLWLAWVSQALVAAGYLAFSGVTGGGDLGVAGNGGLGHVAIPGLRVAELAIGLIAYGLIVRAAKRALATMVGTDDTRSRRLIAWGYYATASVVAVLTGLLNPIGLQVTLASAAASSVGGLAGFISIGASGPPGTATPGLRIARNLPVIIAGVAMATSFALVLGPTLTL